MDLFAATPIQLVEDAEGGIRYWPAFVDEGEAEAWFQALCAHCEWQHQRRPMYDRVVDVPRLQAWYPFDQDSHEGLPASLPLAKMLARVQASVPGGYNSVGLNLYRDGHDSVAMHNDKLHMLVPGQPIALVSLGAPRRMNIRAKAGGRALGIDLEPGSLLVMSHASQVTHEHGIPKTARPAAPRMSAVYRARPAMSPHLQARPENGEMRRSFTPAQALHRQRPASAGQGRQEADAQRLDAGTPSAAPPSRVGGQ
ncbi:alpha-ketoglutarate-dependent dioxygenase AlkB [Pseudoxanthomonas daejeonensis]|uniref:Alpha-ketoglutarate-dependent dioxygenase AlkB n=1 Tax=Pseudoxanthomonas daejeonensis TaxID=266062 RepID=A0ABQ6Z4H6_9GAMM|nr:alpha-ketoglutarate-dependent dioxygenase AlkB [Pseudoxanthomonas daejeonensis]